MHSAGERLELPDRPASWTLGDGAGAVRLARRAGRVAIDIETAGVGAKAYTLKALILGTADQAVVLDPDHAGQRAAFADALVAADTLVLHNSAFDVPVLVGSGIMRPADVDKVWDTLVTARMARPSEHGGNNLGDAAARWLHPEYGSVKTGLASRWRSATGQTVAAMYEAMNLRVSAYAMYAAADAVMTSRLDEALKRPLAEHISQYTGDARYLIHREQTVNRVMLRRSSVGIEIDEDAVTELRSSMAHEVAVADDELARYGVDVTLSDTLVKRDAVRVLAEVGALPPGYPRTKDGRPSADRRALDRIGHPIADAIRRRSVAARFAKDYAAKVLDLARRDGRVHPQVGILAAVTGRSSYGDPPIQQFPPVCRRMFRFDQPATSLDWSSIEPLFYGYAAGEAMIVDRFEAGEDLYLPVAEAAGVTRKTAKVVLLAQIYGQGVAALAAGLGVDEDEARLIVARVLGVLPMIVATNAKIRRLGDGLGWVPSMSGRVLPLAPDPRWPGRFLGYRGVNYHVQGSCYDLLAEVIVAAQDAGLADALYVAVHDELVVATEAADDFQRLMTTPPPAFVELAGRVPVLRTGRADLGRNWREKG